MTDVRPTFTEADFRKATLSEPNESCVQIARRGGGQVEIRDSKTIFGAPSDHRLAFSTEQFDRLLAGTRTAE